jgi:hypothetical protein
LEEQFRARVLENRRAEAAVEVVYREANVFDVYNVVDKKTEPDSVLEFVVGALTKQRIVRCVTSEVHACPIRGVAVDGIVINGLQAFPYPRIREPCLLSPRRKTVRSLRQAF